MFYQPSRKDHGLPHDPLSACIAPRPIGWISTIDNNGVSNLAPFSFFNGVGYNPPTVMFCPNGRDVNGDFSHTLVNVEQVHDFVVNIATYDLREAMNLTSRQLPPGASEFALAGLTEAPSRCVRAPGVAQSPIRLECRHLQTVHLPSTIPGYPLNIVFGEVVGVHISESVLTDGKVDYGKLRPIARLGYRQFAVIDAVFEMQSETFKYRP
ncbi:flavin reductase family protein [Undibacter mobilis]|uniref:Flavin reductase family protein n=1 Tax=Undibacter mobilis TaxID=2292256 RepID=A0A371B7C2_9BRAD|nr:flavin reductase family protein [Undibacter mobilis]RDV03412.1 flavin reductase family protein [Undibacter mobilis]